MKKIVLIGIVIFFAILVLAITVDKYVKVDHDQVFTNSDNENTYRGFCIDMKGDYYLNNLTVGASMVCNTGDCACAVYNLSGGVACPVEANGVAVITPFLENVSLNTGVSDNVAFAGTTLLVTGNRYVIVCGATHGPTYYQMHYRGSEQGTLPDIRPEFNWSSSGFKNTANNDYKGYLIGAYNILTIGLFNVTAEAPTPVTPNIPYNVSGSWNVTSGNNLRKGHLENNLTWNNGGIVNISSDLLSFTVQANFSSNMSCVIDEDWNYSRATAIDMNYKAATTNTTNHAYTVYDTITRGNHCLYCSFVGGENISWSLPNSTSGCLPIVKYDYPNVTLISPSSASSKVQGLVDFNFSAIEWNATELDNLTNCSLYGNFSGTWALNKTIYNVANDTEVNITIDMQVVGDFNWSVTCCNEKNMCNTSLSNWTVKVIEPIFSYSIFLDGINASRLYEFETTANISINTTDTGTFCFNILDDTGRYLNYSCGTGNRSIAYLIDLLRTNKFNDSTLTKTVSNGQTVGIYMNNRTDLSSILFNLTGPTEFVRIQFGDTSIQIPNKLMSNGNITEVKFLYDSINYTALNLTFGSAGTKTIYVNLTTLGDYNDKPGLNFSIKAFELDGENEFDWNVSWNESGWVNNSNSSYPFILANFNNTNVSHLSWVTESLTSTSLGQDSTSDYFLLTAVCGINEHQITEGSAYFDKEVGDMRDIQYAEFNYTFTAGWGAYSCGGNSPWCFSYSTIALTDGTDEVSLFTESGANTENTDLLISIYRVDGNFRVYRNGVFKESVSLASLNIGEIWKIKFISRADSDWGYCSSGSCTTNVYMREIKLGGFGVNKTKGSFNASHNEIISKTINSSKTNVSTAILTADDYFPVGGQIIYYLSNDNSTWEEVTNGETHTFESKGNTTNWKAVIIYNGQDATDSPIIRDVKVEIVPSAISSLDILTGGYTPADTGFHFELNATSTPVYYNGSANKTLSYIKVNCNISSGYDTCLVPITFSTASGGILEISNFNYTRNINPINLSYFLDEVEDEDTIEFNFSATSGPVIQRDFRNRTMVSNLNGSQNANNFTRYFIYPGYNESTPGAILWHYDNKSMFGSDIYCYDENNQNLKSCVIADINNCFGDLTEIHTGYNCTIELANNFSVINLSYSHFDVPEAGDEIFRIVRYNNINRTMPNAIKYAISNWSDVKIVWSEKPGVGWQQYTPGGSELINTLKYIEPGWEIYIYTISGNNFSLYDYNEYWSSSASGTVTMDDLKFDFFGSKNITVVVNSSTRDFNLTMRVKFSKFNLTTFSGEEFWQINPTKRNQSGLIPYGQNETHGFWNVTDLAYDDNLDIYMRLNESVDTCITYFNFTGKNFSSGLDLNISINTSSQILYDDMNETDSGNLFSYTDIKCGGTSVPYLLPYFCFFSICENCTKTSDWQDNCELIV